MGYRFHTYNRKIRNTIDTVEMNNEEVIIQRHELVYTHQAEVYRVCRYYVKSSWMSCWTHSALRLIRSMDHSWLLGIRRIICVVEAITSTFWLCSRKSITHLIWPALVINTWHFGIAQLCGWKKCWYLKITNLKNSKRRKSLKRLSQYDITSAGGYLCKR